MKTLLTLFVFSGLSLFGQAVSFGVKGGANLTDAADRYDESRRYVVGPSIEVRLPARFAIEGNALFNRFGASSSLQQGLATGRIRGNSWDFPVLGKYYFSGQSAGTRPFVSSGFAFRKIWFDDGDRRFGQRGTTPFGSSSEVGVGAVFGGGVSLKAWRLHVAPEFRYTRWGGNNYPVTNLNQAQVLLGIQF